MIISLPSVDLSPFTAGQGKFVSIDQIAPYFSLDQEKHKPFWLVFYNESGSGLDITLQNGKTFSIPAGGWQKQTLLDYIDSYTFSIVYILPSPPVQLLLVDFYSSTEADPQISTLGNSPFGGQTTVATSTAVIQDGQTVGQTLVEATPTAFQQGVLITTDGLMTLRPTTPGAGGLQDAYRVREGGDGAVPSRWSSGIRNDGFGYMQSSDGTTANRSRLWGSVRGWNSDVPIDTLNGQASVGNFGLPLIVAQAIHSLITTNTTVTVVSFTPPADGWYRASYTVTPKNASAVVTAQLNFVDPEASANIGVNFVTVNTGPNPSYISALALAQNSQFPTMPISFWAKGGQAITITHHNTAGSVNDAVTAMIERLG